MVNSQLTSNFSLKGCLYKHLVEASIKKNCLNKSNFSFLDTQLLHSPPDDISRHSVKSLFEYYKNKIEWLILQMTFSQKKIFLRIGTKPISIASKENVTHFINPSPSGVYRTMASLILDADLHKIQSLSL